MNVIKEDDISQVLRERPCYNTLLTRALARQVKAGNMDREIKML